MAYIARSYVPQIRIYNIYNQETPLPPNLLLYSDFNAYNAWWDPLYEKSDAKGDTLAEWIIEYNLALFNKPGVGTFYRPLMQNATNIDLTLSHCSIANQIKFWAIVEDIGSDYFGITFKIQGTRQD
ncbi:hypothetical protein LCER1_G007209 [Lachnellula cervina]|uniref:Endonuclease/exonuclease/phosphatase domain-containing protein n=1 Tax=Lachnellula cervina TaxID=1316786 RepID=A0A7D8UIG8_9HELO|nr:hypothetical protein LCER1_G007209 [Lachnellula cervina]